MASRSATEDSGYRYRAAWSSGRARPLKAIGRRLCAAIITLHADEPAARHGTLTKRLHTEGGEDGDAIATVGTQTNECCPSKRSAAGSIGIIMVSYKLAKLDMWRATASIRPTLAWSNHLPSGSLTGPGRALGIAGCRTP